MMIKNQADIQYNKLIKHIINFGYSDKDNTVRPVYDDGSPAHTMMALGQQFLFDGAEVPIITSKYVAWKSAIKELLWIWQMKSNRVQDLRDMGVNIWNQWELEDGTIGSAYGYQLGKANGFYPKDKVNWNLIDYNSFINSDYHIYLDQVDYLIQELKNNPASRRHITTLWNPDELDDMSLTPCVYETQWHVIEGRLHLQVRCRSNDMALNS